VILSHNIAATNDKQVPYHKSRLTELLQDSIGGKTKTCVIAHLFPGGAHVKESFKTLYFGKKMMACDLGNARKTKSLKL